MSRLNSYNVKKDRKIYGNCQVQSPNGVLMFRCDQKKAYWYINRNLGDIIQKEPLIVRLNFEPKGLGNHQKEFGLSEMLNKCVSCGGENFLTKHHIVPYCYRRYFPLEIKSHNFHDVMPLCTNCHDTYERKADELKSKLSIEYNAPLNGVNDKRNYTKFSKIAKTLLSDDVYKIPNKRVKEIKSNVKDFFGIKRLSKKRLYSIASMRSTQPNKTHGLIVIENIKDIDSFIIMWRKHFIEEMNCLHLPKNWSTETK